MGRLVQLHAEELFDLQPLMQIFLILFLPAAKTAGAVAAAVSNAEEGEGGAAALGALGDELDGHNTATNAAVKVGTKAVGGQPGAKNVVPPEVTDQLYCSQREATR